MKIAALIATRGRPQQVVGIIESMRMLSTGDHEIEFLVACDEDDPASTKECLYNYILCGPRKIEGSIKLRSIFSKGVKVYSGPRPIGPGSLWNRLAKLTDADAFITLPDDGIIATPRWDHCINWAWRNHNWAHPDLKIGGLRDAANPGQPTLFVIGRRWYELVGELLDECYPFWFSDTAISEIYSFITGGGLPCLPIDVASKSGEWNPRLRKMKLWWTHYWLTRRERIETASRIRTELNLAAPPNLARLEALWEERDAGGLPNSEEIVRQIQNPAPLDARYLEAEHAAIEYVRVHSGRTFEPSKDDGDRF